MAVHQQGQSRHPSESIVCGLLGGIPGLSQGRVECLYLRINQVFPKDRICHQVVISGCCYMQKATKEVRQVQHPKPDSPGGMAGRVGLNDLDPDVFRPGPESQISLYHTLEQETTSRCDLLIGVVSQPHRV